MKSIIKTFSAVTLGCMLPLAAQVTETEQSTDVSQNADGSVTQTETTTTTTFNPEARTKIVKFFEQHKDHPHGLPPGWAARVKAKDMPTAWRTTRIEPGVVFEEEQRTYLVEAPPELIEVLPEASTTKVRYYVAGSNVVAVDETYRVVDSIQIPSVKIVAD